jgi:hypothetical protein
MFEFLRTSLFARWSSTVDRGPALKGLFIKAGALWLVGLGWAYGLQSVPAKVVIQVQYDPAAVPGSPVYSETLANLIYPVGKGPVSQGYDAEPLPILVFFRGGNSNKFNLGELEIDNQAAAAHLGGMIGVSCNYAEVENNEDYRVAVASVARLIQYLRANAASLNVDPSRVFTVGRSFGTVVGYGLALKEDYQVVGSSDPLLSQSSRPQYYAPRFGPSQLTCFAEDVGSWTPTLNTLFFPGKVFSESTAAERLAESPTWWLLNPELFGRQYTPPMCVVFAQTYTDTCENNIDVHSGLFGDLMLQAIETYARQAGDPTYERRCSSIDLGVFPEAEVAVVVWCVKRLAEDYDGLWLTPPAGAIGTVGGNVTLQVHGAVPGATVFFFRGQQPGTFPMPGCPNLQGQLTDWQGLGSSVATANGVATLVFPVAGSQFNVKDYFHAVDFGNCEMSNLLPHKYY